jgi:enterochelin esterase family protein
MEIIMQMMVDSVMRLFDTYFDQTQMPGSERWWLTMQEKGIPAIKNKTHWSCDVLFLWRDPQGNETASQTKTVVIDVNSVTDHHSTQPSTMARFIGTDIWFWCAELPLEWRGSYQFIPLTAAEIPNRKNEDDLQNQQRRWWMSIMPFAIPDRLNTRCGYMSNWGTQLSILHMPDAPSQTAWFARDNGFDDEPKGLHRLNWDSLILNNSRSVWVYETKSCDFNTEEKAQRPLVLLLDGRFWAENMPIFSALDFDTQQGHIPSAVYVLIDEINGQSRSVELPCNTEFWQAVLTELIPWLKEDFIFTDRPEKTVVAGQSFGGLAAMYAGYNWPDRFGCVLSQSGSFWWPDLDLAEKVADRIHGRLPGVRGWLVNHIEANPIHRPLNVYLEAGTREGEMISLSESMKDVLAEGGHQVMLNSFEGGHDRACWRGGLLTGLNWLLK